MRLYKDPHPAMDGDFLYLKQINHFFCAQPNLLKRRGVLVYIVPKQLKIKYHENHYKKTKHS